MNDIATQAELVEMQAELVEMENFKLCKAAYDGDLETVKTLLLDGVSVDCRSGQHDATPLMQACKRDHLAVVKLLVAHGANVALQDSDGFSALHWACRKDPTKAYFQETSSDCAEFLLSHPYTGLEGSFLMETKDMFGNTPLHWAARDSCLGAVKVLLHHHQRHQQLDKSRNQPKVKYSVNESAETPTKQNKSILDYINTTDDQKHTPLMLAARHTRHSAGQQILSMLLELGADIDIDSPEGPALHMAAKSRNYAAVNTLVTAGADPNTLLCFKYDCGDAFVNVVMREVLPAELASTVTGYLPMCYY